MSCNRISILTPDPVAADAGMLPTVGDAIGMSKIADFLNALGGGLRTGKVRLNVGAVQAEGQVAFDSFADADTVTVNGVVLTGKTTPSGASQFAVGASDEACANNFWAKIVASALDKIVGVVTAYRRGTILLSSFVADDTVTINGLIFTGKTTPNASDPRQFAIGGTDAKTAENLMNAILACKPLFPSNLGGNLISVSRSTATLTVNYYGALTFAISAHGTLDNDMVQMVSIVGGQIGNLMTLAISARGTKTDPTGGTEGTEVVFSQNSPNL